MNNICLFNIYKDVFFPISEWLSSYSCEIFNRDSMYLQSVFINDEFFLIKVTKYRNK